RLRTYRRRIVSGLFFDRAGERQNAVRWAVYAAHEFRTRPNHTHDTRDTHSPPGRSGECRECRECNSADGPSEHDTDADRHADAWEDPADRTPPHDLDPGDGPYRERR